MPSLFWRTDLGPGPVRVVTGLFVAGGDIAASEGSTVYLFVPTDREYSRYSRYNLYAPVTGMVPIRTGLPAESIAVATSERIAVLDGRGGSFFLAAETGPEQGAAFADVAAGDLDGDGRDEIVAAAPGLESIYVYRLVVGQGSALSLELVGIRVTPGIPRYVGVFQRPDGVNVIAAAFEDKGNWGVSTYRLTEEGFEEGPGLAAQPVAITAMAEGNFLERPGEELALGSAGGMVRLLGSDQALEVLLTTVPLGTLVGALASSGGYYAQLAAGTPEGNVFIFGYPAGSVPQQSFSPVEGVTGLGFLPGGRVAAGTEAGGLQVWWQIRTEKTWDYMVKPGDTLWIIAARYGSTIESILAVNETIKNPDLIRPGQIIRIPDL